MDFSIRPARSDDVAFLWRMLYEAAYWHPRAPRPQFREMLANDHLARYVEGWGCPSDIGVIAEDASRRPLGAAWLRILAAQRPGYGFIDDSTSEISVAVEDDCRGRGIGTALLKTLLQEASTSGLHAVSLSASEENPALHLYERLGFVKVKLVAGSWTMRRRLR